MTYRLWFALFVLLLCTSGPHAPLCRADDPSPDAQAEPDSAEQSPDEVEPEKGRSLAQTWLERMRNLTRRNPNEKNSDDVKSVFKDVVADAAQATVLVFVADEPKAYGAIVAADGYVLTKSSELAGGDAISCRLKDGRHLSAKVVGVHDESDLAMLKVDAKDLPIVSWRDEPPAVGSWLATTGIDETPLALGVMSVHPRKIKPLPGVLGVSLEDDAKGALISEVMRRSAAEKAGLKKNDVVLAIDGKKVKDRQAMISTIQKHKPGDEVTLKVARGDEELALTAKLGSYFTGPAARGDFQNQLGGSLSMRRAGFEEALQHDTTLGAHECGGPVVDLDGKVVGINIARAGRVASYALPSRIVVALLDDLKSGKLSPQVRAPSIDRLAELREEIQQMQSVVNEQEAARVAAEQQLQAAEKALASAQAARDAAVKNSEASQNAAQAAMMRLRQLQEEFDALQKK